MDYTASSRDGGSGPDSRLAGPTVARILLGGRLRELREARGITREAAGDAIRASASKISRLELGRTGFKRGDVADLLTLYGVVEDSERQDLLALVGPARAAGWLRAYGDLLPAGMQTRVELEQAASLVRSYEPQFIPALLQTADYARALAHLERPHASPAEVDRRVSLLARRQEILSREEPPELWVVIDEAALRRNVGGIANMRAQLRRLIELGNVPHVSVQVMPFRAGVAAGGAITILRFPEHELADAVYLDQPAASLHLDRPADVSHYHKVMDRLSVRAEPPAATAALLREIHGQC